MERKAEDENAGARTQVRNQAFSSPTTPRSAHTGDGSRGRGRRWANTLCSGHSPEPKANQKNREKAEEEKSRFEKDAYLLFNHSTKPFLTILVKHPG